MRLRTFVALGLVPFGCRGTPPGPQSSSALAAVVDTLRPLVETAVGLRFKTAPKFALRTREQVQQYLLGKLTQEFPASKVEGVEAAYRLLELIPDTLALKPLLLSLYAEQVAGFYDPDSTVLYAVAGAQPDQARLILAHELVHALQHQYLPLDSLLHDLSDGDRLAASQAVLEGQATIAMIAVMAPGQPVLENPDFWKLYRDQVREAQTSMPVFRSAPLVLREGLVFPYLAGAEFMRWWRANHSAEPLPARSELPRSTEQVLHPDRYAAGDQPVRLRFVEPASGVLHEDTLGELELQVFAAVMRGGGELLTSLPMGWGGDRFRVYRSPSGPALVWYLAWDDSVSARRFAAGAAARFAARARSGYRTQVDRLDLGGRPTVRVVRAPAGWERWADLPRAEATP